MTEKKRPNIRYAVMTEDKREKHEKFIDYMSLEEVNIQAQGMPISAGMGIFFDRMVWEIGNLYDALNYKKDKQLGEDDE